MLRPVLTIMFVLFCQYAICHTYQHTAEKAVALNKLKEVGVNVAKVNLSIVEDTGALCVFEDAINNSFVIVASKLQSAYLYWGVCILIKIKTIFLYSCIISNDCTAW